MKYETQRVALPFFAVAMALFALQVIFGILAATVYVLPEFMVELVPFHIMRMSHTNLLIVWLLIGFMGCTYFLMPEEAETEIHSPLIAYIQLAIFAVAGAGALVSYQFGIHEGREFLEQPLWSKILITISFLLFLYNTSMTLLRGRRTAINSILMLGLWLAAIFWFFAFYNPSNLALDKLYWWWIVHVWVEGVWELIMASLLAYLLIKLTGVDREIIEKWLYVIIGLALFSGLLGTGHHYYWIGAPGYWQPIGSFFSTLEVAPFFAMVMFAFYGAYVMMVLAVVTYAMPQLRRIQPFNQIINMWSFWLMTASMCFMTFTLTFAGVVQTHLQRVMGINYMEVQEQLSLFYMMRLGAGCVVAVAAVVFLWAVFGPAREELPAGETGVANA